MDATAVEPTYTPVFKYLVPRGWRDPERLVRLAACSICGALVVTQNDTGDVRPMADAHTVWHASIGG